MYIIHSIIHSIIHKIYILLRLEFFNILMAQKKMSKIKEGLLHFCQGLKNFQWKN